MASCKACLQGSGAVYRKWVSCTTTSMSGAIKMMTNEVSASLAADLASGCSNHCNHYNRAKALALPTVRSSAPCSKFCSDAEVLADPCTVLNSRPGAAAVQAAAAVRAGAAVRQAEVQGSHGSAGQLARRAGSLLRHTRCEELKRLRH